MALSHVFTSPIADFTGTVTVFNSAGATVTANATEIVRPSNWNSVHNEFLTISGNTAGASTMSGTNIVLQGGNNVTLSANGNSLVISGPNTAAQSVQTQNMVSVNGSTGSIVFANSNGITFGGNASTITASHNGLTTARASNDGIGLNTAQTNVTWTVNSSGISVNAAGYAGTGTSKTGAVALTLNSNGLAFNAGSLAGTGFTSTTTAGTAIVATHDTNGLSMGIPTFVTAAAGGGINLAAGTQTATSGTVVFANSNSITFGMSGSTQVTASFSQTNQTGNFYVTANSTQLSSTAGNDLRSVSFAGAGGASVGVSGGVVVVSAPTLTSLSVTGALSASSNGSTISLGVGTVTANAASNTTQNSTGTINLNALTFQGAGVASVGFSNGSVVISVPSGGGAGDGVNILAAGTQTANTTGTVLFQNSNGITFGMSNSSVITASHNGITSQSSQSAIKAFGVSNTGQTAGNTGVSTGVDWVLAGSGSLTLSQSTAGGGPNTVWFQHPAWITTQSNQAFSAGAASSTFQTLIFQDSLNLSFSNNAGSVRVTHNLAGTSTGSAGANVGISMTLNSSGLNLSVTTPATVAQTNQTLSFAATSNTTGNTSGMSVDARSITLQGRGNVSVGYSTSAGGSSIVVSGSVPVVSNAIQSVGSATGSGTNTSRFAADDHVHAGVFSFGVSTGGNTAGNTRVDVGQFVFVGSNITLSQGTAAGGLNTITISAGAGGGVNPAASASNGSFAFTTLNFSNANNVTFGTSAGGIITASVAAPGAAAEQNAINLLGANTAGNTTATGSTIGMSGINLTLSGTNASQIVFSAPATSSLVGTNGISISTAGSTISLSGVPTYTALTFQNRQLGASSHTSGQNTVWLAPMRIVAPVNAGTGLFVVSITGTVTSNQTNTVGQTWEGALYKVTGTNQSRLDTIFSSTMGFTFWNSGTASVSYSYNVTSGSSAGSNLMTASVFGLRVLTFNVGSTLDPGLYAWGYRISSSSAGNSSINRTFNVVVDNPMPVAGGFIGSATNASIGYADGGKYSATSGAMPVSFLLSEVVQTNNVIPYIKFGTI